MARHLLFPRLLGLSALVALTGTLAPAAPVFAQEAGQAAPGEQTADFAPLHEQWQQVQKQLVDLQNEYRTADAERQEAIRKEFQTLVSQAQQLLPKLKTAALEAYRAEPNANRDVVRVLLGFMNSANMEDRYEETREIGELLSKGGTQAKGVSDMLGIAAYALDDFDAAKRYLDQASSEGAISQEGRQLLGDIAEAQQLWKAEQKLREQEAAADDLPRVEFTTSEGKMVLELYENEAPETVGNFVSLVEDGFYDGLTFHRVIGGFMAQGGCPQGTGTGGPGYEIYCECDKENHRKHFRGTLSMAHAGEDTGGSQFFITFRRTPHLDGKHTVFGRVIEGQEVLARLQREPGRAGPADKIVKAVVLRKRDHEYKPNKVQ